MSPIGWLLIALLGALVMAVCDDFDPFQPA